MMSEPMIIEVPGLMSREKDEEVLSLLRQGKNREAAEICSRNETSPEIRFHPSIVSENNDMVLELLREKKFYEAAELCFKVQTSKAIRSNRLIVEENNRRVEELLQQKKVDAAAELCFSRTTTKDVKLRVLEWFVKNGKICIAGKSLSELNNKTLTSLLIFCQGTETGKCSRISILEKKNPRKRMWTIV
jgi:hypothetical protein